jgi:fatty acid CoA ligase FadD9
VDAYGSTEVARIAVNGIVQPDVEYKLIDMPDLGYTRLDRPYPRGELAVKSPRQTPGYYHNPDANAALYDDDGFVRTGDIVEERGPRRIMWIDRKNDVVRLANGEYVNLSRLEALFAAESPFIDQLFVFGESSRECLLAVVVPNRAAISEHEKARGAASLQPEQSLRTLLRAELDRIAASSSLRSFDVPRDFLVADEPFTNENGLLSDAQKLRRPKLKDRYGWRLEQLYREVERRQVRARIDAREHETATVDDPVRAAVLAAIGREELGPPSFDNSFVALGGDSLAAIRLQEIVRDLTGASLDVAALLDPRKSVAEVLDRLRRRTKVQPTSFENVHGDGAAVIRARDYDLRKFVPEQLLARAQQLPLAQEPRHYLLTGAAGFLGHVLLAELLDMVDRGSSVTCIVRAQSDAAARDRVARRFSDGGAATASSFEAACADQRLRILAGDVASPLLGLETATYEGLSETIDTVLHGAALVNHILSYRDLFDANVVGTGQIMGFAVRRRRKRIHFISTTGLAVGLRRDVPILETESARALWARRPISPSRGVYALGYTTTKWASEIMLAALQRECAVPVAIYRCSMLLPHREQRSVINAADTFARLVYGLVKTGIAPRSFYADEYRGERHYDGLPVDFVARAIAHGGTRADEGLHTYHACNSNWNDGVSMDTVVDWIQSAGHPIERVDYSTWYAEFVRRLARLSPDEHRRSPAAIASRWRDPARSGAPKLDARVFRAKLEQIGVKRVPSLTEAYVHHCVAAICGDHA